MSTHANDDTAAGWTTERLSRRDVMRRAAALGAAASVAGPLARPAVRVGAVRQQTTITFWHGLTGGDGTEQMTNIIDRYNAENQDGIRVEQTPIPSWDEVFSKWVLAAASGRPPDVVMYHPSELPEFAARKVTAPIDELVQRVGFDFVGVNETVLQSCRWEDQLYAVPNDTHQLGLYFNADLAEEAGLDPNRPPSTRDEFLDWARRLTVRDGDNVSQYGLSMPSEGAVPRWTWYSLLHQNGGRFLDDQGKSAVDSPESAEALQFLVDLIHSERVAPEGAGGGADPVAAKQVAMWFVGPWEVTERRRQGIRLGTAPMPTIGRQAATWTNSHCQSISRQDDDARYEPSVRFMKWLYDHYYLLAREIGLIPVSPAALTSPEFTQDERYPLYAPFIDQPLVYEPSLTQYTSIFSFEKPTPLSTSLQEALTRRKTVEEAVRDMKQGIDEQLAKEF